jgi:hypothetical protein
MAPSHFRCLLRHLAQTKDLIPGALFAGPPCIVLLCSLNGNETGSDRPPSAETVGACTPRSLSSCACDRAVMGYVACPLAESVECDVVDPILCRTWRWPANPMFVVWLNTLEDKLCCGKSKRGQRTSRKVYHYARSATLRLLHPYLNVCSCIYNQGPVRTLLIYGLICY